MNKIIYVETGTTDTYLNFATEYYIATESDIFQKTNCDAVFLFWRTTPTVMVGKYQNVYEEINLKYVEEHNINIVRRLSGGGTIYTDLGGWQFTFISEKNVNEINFSEYLEPVLSALESIGIKASFNGRNDIIVDGRKISGNAQYKLGNKTVHHGSLLFDTDIEAMVSSTVVSDYKIISKGIKSVRERVTNVREHLDKDLSPDMFKQLIVSHIIHDGEEYKLSESEQDKLYTIAAEHFNNKEIIYGKNPKFSIEKAGRFTGGSVTIKLDVKKNIICDCSITGDFFATVPSSEIQNAMVGCEYNKAAIIAALHKAKLDNAFYNITIQDIAGLITQ